MKKVLSSLGFRRGWIYEAIVSTESGEGRDAAPMGVSSKDLSAIDLSVYKSSQTCKNIASTGLFAVNLSDDLLLFYESLYEKDKLRYKKPKHFRSPVLSGAGCFMQCIVYYRRDLGDRIHYKARIASFMPAKKRIGLINRGGSLALEALIKASRIPHASGTERRRMKKELRYIAAAARRVAPGSPAARLSFLLSSLRL